MAPDAISRRPDYENRGKEKPQILLPAELFHGFVGGENISVIASYTPDLPEVEGDLLIVPKSRQLSILQQRHDSLMAGHPGIKHTLELRKRDYWWPGMMWDVRKYVLSCDMCGRCKPDHSLPGGKLVPLPIPTQPWKSISMDFITDLPPCQGFDLIFVVVD